MGEDQKEGGCRPPPPAAVSEGFHGRRKMDIPGPESGRGEHMDRGVCQPTELLHSSQLCLTWDSVLVDARKDFISVGHSSEEQTPSWLQVLSVAISTRHLDCLFIRPLTGSLINVRHYCLLTALLSSGVTSRREAGLQPALTETRQRSPSTSQPWWAWQLLG